MNQSRRALIVSIVYSIPLLIWFIAQLQFIDWNTASLQSLFLQTLFAVLLLQFFSIALLLINHPEGNWRDNSLAVIHILLFPLPFMSLSWLTGSASLSILLKSFVCLSSAAVLLFFIQQGSQLIPDRIKIIGTLFTLTQILLAVMLWNFRHIWWNWLVL